TKEFEMIGEFIIEILEGLQANPDDNSAAEASVRERVIALCKDFPIY
ncbi:MAG: serine hydroxymethyltransferase, partial [Alphaproteobacteria bacterium]